MIDNLDVSSSALVAQRVRMDAIAGNIANAFTTHQEDGTVEPYRRRVVSFAPQRPDGGPGVRVEDISEDPSAFVERYEPFSPDAIPEGPRAGYVRYPNVNITMEYIDGIEAGRAYEANVAMMNVTKNMVQQALRLFA